MKRLSLLKKIALGSGAIAAVTPIALMATSCAIEEVSADYIDFNSIKFGYDYSKATTGLTSFKRLLFGSKKVMNGNYILFYGSNTSNSVCKFYSGSEYIRGRDQWFTPWSQEHPEGLFYESTFYKGIAKCQEACNNFGIFNVIDFFDFKFYDKKGHQIYISDHEDRRLEVVSPWQKWTSDIITCTKKYNNSKNVPEKYDWDETSVSDKEYIRNDDSAVRIRTFCETGNQVYPTNDKRKTKFAETESSSNPSRMLIFKDGVLQKQNGDDDIGQIPTTQEAWHDIIIKFFKDEQK